jgi:NAD(P)-dependent dehydrogenase (short-subunit alcohol dehydrogenase family)
MTLCKCLDAFLASLNASYINAQDLRVDGGVDDSLYRR